MGMPPIPDGAGSALFFEMDFDPAAPDFEFGALATTLAGHGASLEQSWTGYEPRELDRFKAFRHMIPETVNEIIAERKQTYPEIHKLGTDLAVPDEHLQAMWQLYKTGCTSGNFEWLAFGHIGNNHLHVNILPRNPAEQERGMALFTRFAQQAAEWGGSVSAEHGIGKLKEKILHLMFSADQIEQMRAVKRALDPEDLLNPGDLFAC